MTGAQGLLPAALTRGARLSAVGVTLGALAGLSCLWLPEAGRVAAFAAVVYWLIAPAVLLSALVLTLNDLQSGARSLYASLGGAAGLLLAETALAVVLASLFFYTLALNVPVFLRGHDGAQMRQLLLAHIGPGGLLAVLAVSLAGAAAIAVWAQRRASR